jgi:hypothetical protein
MIGVIYQHGWRAFLLSGECQEWGDILGLQMEDSKVAVP